MKNLRQQFGIALLMTLTTTVLFGVLYPLAVTALAQLLFPEEANGQFVRRDGRAIGSQIIGQPFSGPQYFHPRPSAAGMRGYDAMASGGSNLAPTNRRLIDRVEMAVVGWRPENSDTFVPIDLVTASASGLDLHISPAAAEFQIGSVARERRIAEGELRNLVRQHTEPRQLGILGEPRVSVLRLNLALDATYPAR